VTVGGAANIYINLQGRESTGIVPLEQYEDLQKEIEKVFQAINDPVTNERVFEIILKKPRSEFILQEKSRFGAVDAAKSRDRERDFHVFGEDTGDVFVVTIPGYNLDFNPGTGAAIGNFFQPSTFFGQHGYDPRLPEMKAIFYAAGPDFKRETIKAVENIDIAPTVADVVGISPPKQAQGRKIHIHDHAKP
jgi:predicted AlkP superfamily phosphohydrolase/phosphomutase